MTATLCGLVTADFSGIDGSGSISVPGVKIGDVVVNVWRIDASHAFASSAYEPVITVDDEIQQLGVNMSAATLKILLFRGP